MKTFSSVPSRIRDLALFLACALACVFSGPALQAQSAATAPAGDASTKARATAMQSKIQLHLSQLHQREQAQASVHELAFRWMQIGAEYGNSGEVDRAENAYNHTLKLLAPEPAEAVLYADTYDQLGALYRIYGRTEDAMRCYRASLAVREPLGDPLETARSRAHLAELALEAHHYKEAYTETDQAYNSLTKMHDPDDSDRISALIVRAYAQCGMRKFHQGEQDAQQALEISRKDFPGTTMQVGASLVVLGLTQLKNSENTLAEVSLHDAVDIMQAHLADADPRLVFAMTQYHQSLRAMHRDEEAQLIHRKLEAIALQPSCANCTVSAFTLRSPSFPQQLSAGDHSGRATGGAVAWTQGAPLLQVP